MQSFNTQSVLSGALVAQTPAWQHNSQAGFGRNPAREWARPMKGRPRRISMRQALAHILGIAMEVKAIRNNR